MSVPLLRQSELAVLMVDTATIYGPDPASDTDAYDVQLLQFTCRLTPRTQTTMGTGIGPVRTSYWHLMYPPDVTLPDGYWELAALGMRFAPIANSGSAFRDLQGNVAWRSLDLDQIGPSLH